MSSKRKLLIIAFVVMAMIGTFAAVTKADVTGSFTTHISIHPVCTGFPAEWLEGCPGPWETEIQPLWFDFQNEINITVVISGLSTTLHSHFGLAGVEDVTLNYAATLGALDIRLRPLHRHLRLPLLGELLLRDHQQPLPAL